MIDFILFIEIKHVTNMEWELESIRGKAIHWYSNQTHKGVKPPVTLSLYIL